MTTKLVYQLDENNILTSMSVAEESPLEPGVFMIPAGCVDTDIVPPPTTGNEYVYWKDGNWWLGTYVDPNAPSPEAVAREWRNAELNRADIVLLKIQDGMPNLGTVADWRKYRVALRTWPEAEGFPSVESAPKAPDNK